MTEMGDCFRLWRAEKADKRAKNRYASTKILQEHGVEFERSNCGAHLIVSGKNCIIDFWPGTGLFIPRDNTPQGRGVRNLLKLC